MLGLVGGSNQSQPTIMFIVSFSGNNTLTRVHIFHKTWNKSIEPTTIIAVPKKGQKRVFLLISFLLFLEIDSCSRDKDQVGLRLVLRLGWENRTLILLDQYVKRMLVSLFPFLRIRYAVGVYCYHSVLINKDAKRSICTTPRLLNHYIICKVGTS